MTVSVSQLAHFSAKHMAGTKGAATGSSGGSDGLGDFMALLDQLGITVAADGSASGDILALLGKADTLGKDGLAGLTAKLDTISAKTDTASTAASKALLAALGTQVDAKDGASDPATALSELLKSIEAKSDTGYTGDDSGTAGTAATADGPDISQLLALIAAMAAKPAPAVATVTPAITSETITTTTAAAAAKPSSGAAAVIADITAKLTPAEGEIDDDPSISLADIKARFKDQLDAWSAVRKLGTSDTAGNGTAAAPVDKRITDMLARLNSQPPAQAPVQPAVAAILKASDNNGKTDNGIAATTGVDTGLIASDSLLGTTSGTPAIATTPSSDNLAVDTSDSETLVQHHLDLARDSEWLDTLAKDIARAANHDSQLRFQLNPEHLGSLKVELINSAQGTSVKLTADTEAARSILADAQPRLIAEARAQGLRISEATVDLGGHGSHQRPNAEPVVMLRTPVASLAAEVEQDTPAVSGERYA